MTNKIKKGAKLQDLHPKRTARKIVVEKVAPTACTVKNIKTGKVTTVATQRLSSPSRFKVVA